MIPLHRQRLWLLAALLLTALKLWLTRGQGVYALGGAGHKDWLTIELAQYLARGEWLGPYRELTLAQGPFYPLFIAAAFWVGAPLFLAQHLFYAAACACFTQALRPALPSSGARLALYALLLANPMSYDGPGMGRVLPQQVQGPLGLLIFAGLVGLSLRPAEPARRQAPWVLLLGLAGAAFFLTGGKMGWFAPAVLVLAGAWLLGAWKFSPAAAASATRWLATALIVAALPVLFVCVKNKRHYDRFTTSEAGVMVGLEDRAAGTGSSLWRAVDFVTSFSRFSARVPPSTGSPEELQLFRDLTHERLSPPVGELDKVGAARYVLNGRKTEWLQQTGKILRPVLMALFWLAQVLWLVRVAWLGSRRRWNLPLTVAAAAWTACAAAMLLPATAVSGLTVSTFGPVYPLLLVFIFAALWEVTTAWRKPGAP